MSEFTPEETRQIASDWFNWHQGKYDTSGMSAEEKRAKGLEIDARYKQACNQGKREVELRSAQRSREVRCPNCGSTQIAAGNKGFGLGKAAAGGLLLGPVGLLGGFVGSGQVMLSCLRCGKKWKAGM